MPEQLRIELVLNYVLVDVESSTMYETEIILMYGFVLPSKGHTSSRSPIQYVIKAM